MKIHTHTKECHFNVCLSQFWVFSHLILSETNQPQLITATEIQAFRLATDKVVILASCENEFGPPELESPSFKAIIYSISIFYILDLNVYIIYDK